MKDKILNLLIFCLQAQEKGCNVELEFGLDSVRLYHFEPRAADYKGKILKNLTLYYDASDSVEQLNEMESYLRELVKND